MQVSRMGSSLESHLLYDFFIQNSKLGLEQRFYQKFKNLRTGISGSFNFGIGIGGSPEN